MKKCGIEPQEEIQKVIEKIRELIDDKTETVAGKEYILEFQPHNQSLKKDKILMNLDSCHRVLKSEPI